MRQEKIYSTFFPGLVRCVCAAVFLTVAAGCEKKADEPESGLPEMQEISDKDFFLRSVCEKDADGKYSLKFGVPDEKDPSVLHMKSETPESCLDFFNSFIRGEDSDHSDYAEDFTYAFSDGGSISYSWSGDGLSAGRISVDVAELPYVREIVFIPTDNWPHNSGGGVYEFGKVYEVDGEEYICIKESYGDKGFLLGIGKIPWSESNLGAVKRLMFDRPEDEFYVSYLTSTAKYAKNAYADFLEKIYEEKRSELPVNPELYPDILLYKFGILVSEPKFRAYYFECFYYDPYGKCFGTLKREKLGVIVKYALKFVEFGPEEVL